ncbi:unnamed protein product [Closterium sp. Naga37s-1]|nr:unnamed protein product [Closterium sp. Naga37s-1]
MQGRVGDGPAGASACFVGGFLFVAAPTSCQSFRYTGSRPPPSGQTLQESGSEEDDEEEEGEGAEDEDDEGSEDDSEAGWDPKTHGGGEGGGDDDEDHKMDGLEPEEVEEEVGEGGGGAATEAASQHVAEGGGSVGVKLRDETFPRGGYKGVPDGCVDKWPHAKCWPNLTKKKGKGVGGAEGSGGIKWFMTSKLSTVELRQAIAKLVVTCDLPFRIVEPEAFRELLILLNRNCAQKNFIPSRWTVSRDTVVFAAAALQSAIAEMLAKEGELGCKVSFTIDMWTAPNGKAWLVVTGHWIDENFQLRTAVLEFREMLGRHGGREMAQVVEETVVRWGLEGRCLGFTTDNASSNIAAFRRMSEEGGGQCFFNPRMHFRQCVGVLGSGPVRGNLEGVYGLGLSKADKKVESLRLTDADWETLQAVKTFLSPFAKVSKAAEGAAYPTVSMVVPYYNGLIDAMESRLAKGPSATLQLMLVAALGHLKKYAYMTSNEYWIATFLDPSMKAAWFADTYCEKLHPETDRRVRPCPASGVVIKLVRDRVAEYQARAAELAPRPTPLALVVEEEEGDEVEDDDDAQFLPSRRRLAARLSASQEAGGRTLRRMARDNLAIPATSASSERVFSLGRNLISWKRHRLASQRTRAVMILRSWYSSHPGQRIGEGRRPRGVAPPEFAIEGEGLEDNEEEEEEGVEADAAGGEDAVVGSSSGAMA